MNSATQRRCSSALHGYTSVQPTKFNTHTHMSKICWHIRHHNKNRGLINSRLMTSVLTPDSNILGEHPGAGGCGNDQHTRISLAKAMSIMLLKESLTSVRISWMASLMDFRKNLSSVWRHLRVKECLVWCCAKKNKKTPTFLLTFNFECLLGFYLSVILVSSIHFSSRDFSYCNKRKR